MRTIVVGLTLIIAAHCAVSLARAASRKEECDDPKQSTKLWEQVYDLCIATSRPHAGYCVRVGSSYVVFTNPAQSDKPYRLLFIPTASVPGIEAAAQLPATTWETYLREAWNARALFLTKLHSPQPLENVGLAINSAFDRGMCHLHIHIDCVGARTRSAVQGQSVGSAWVRLTGLPAFVARRFSESQFAEMAHEAIQSSRPQETLASLTLVFVPAPEHGVYVLRSHHGSGGSGAGEQLLAAQCRASRSYNSFE